MLVKFPLYVSLYVYIQLLNNALSKIIKHLLEIPIFSLRFHEIFKNIKFFKVGNVVCCLEATTEQQPTINEQQITQLP